MHLKAKLLDIATESSAVVLMNAKKMRANDLHAGDRVVLALKSKEIVAVINVVQNGFLLHEEQLGLFVETAKALDAKEDDAISISLPKNSDSARLIKKKMRGEYLDEEEMYAIVKDIVIRNLTDVELTYFVAACSMQLLTFKEIVFLTKSMADTGTKIQFNKRLVIDKHCIGGVPGNRTTLITVPIMASLGLTIPKTSSRAITSPAGTADTMEVFANVELSAEKLKHVVEHVGACLVWGGGVNLAPADDRIIRIERPLSIDVTGLMLASVMAKKYSVGSTHVLIDIPYGPGAKVETIERAKKLKRSFLAIGKDLNMKLFVVITDGSQPIGYGIGPLLEAYDVLAVLKNDPSAPQDLREKALILAGDFLEFIGHASKGKGKAMAEEELVSGRAFTKFKEIIDAQGKKEIPPLAKYKHDILAKQSGKVIEIHNTRISKIAHVAGAPASKGAGILLYAKVSTIIAHEDKLCTIYAESEEKLQQAIQYFKTNDPYIIE